MTYLQFRRVKMWMWMFLSEEKIFVNKAAFMFDCCPTYEME